MYSIYRQGITLLHKILYNIVNIRFSPDISSFKQFKFFPDQITLCSSKLSYLLFHRSIESFIENINFNKILFTK